MKKTRTKHSAEFKARVALATVPEQETVPAIFRRYKVHANQVCGTGSRLKGWHRCRRREAALTRASPKPASSLVFLDADRDDTMTYLEFIENARLISSVTSCTTTGDADYPGTAVKVADPGGQELFHVVVDARGEQQGLFMSSAHPLRMPLALLEDIFAKSKKLVKTVD